LDGATVVEALKRHGHAEVIYEPKLEAIPDRLRRMIRPGDLVLTLGAGDVWKVGEELIRYAAGGSGGERPRRSA
jgi:UDP-N-acetylmuramate--alanine ligase